MIKNNGKTANQRKIKIYQTTINFCILDFKRGRILAFGDYEQIDYALNYLIIDLSITPRRIEKCPSVLYFGVNNLREKCYQKG